MVSYRVKEIFILLVLVSLLFSIPAFAMANKDAEHFINLAQEHVDSGKYEEAVDAYKQAIKIDQGNEVAYYKLGTTYRSAGKMQESVDALNQATKIKTDFAEAHYELGLTYRS